MKYQVIFILIDKLGENPARSCRCNGEQIQLCHWEGWISYEPKSEELPGIVLHLRDTEK